MARTGIAALIALAALLAALVAARPACAIELKYDNDKADAFEHSRTDGQGVVFSRPDFKEAYLVSALIYAKRYGEAYEPSEVSGNMVVLDMDGNILARSLVPFSKFSGTPSWVEVKFDPIKLKDRFIIMFLSDSTDARGIDVGYAKDVKVTHSRVGNPSWGIKAIAGRTIEWMIRAVVESNIESKKAVSAKDLVGPRFIGYDSGEAKGFETFKVKEAAMVKFTPGRDVKLASIYVYGKVKGNWYTAAYDFAIFVLDKDLRILKYYNFPYKSFSNKADWIELDVPTVEVPGEFYLVFKPDTRDDAGLYVGYDDSKNDGHSFVGVPGTIFGWKLPEPEATTNWLIRVKTE
jgi:hypothetical protein